MIIAKFVIEATKCCDGATAHPPASREASVVDSESFDPITSDRQTPVHKIMQSLLSARFGEIAHHTQATHDVPLAKEEYNHNGNKCN